jgi:hypothetical protein
MTVRSKQLGPPTLLTPAATDLTIYTCPAGARTILKSITFFNTAGNTATARWKNAAGTQIYNLWRTTAADTTIQLPWFVLNAGESIVVRSVNAGQAIVALSGTELPLP